MYMLSSAYMWLVGSFFTWHCIKFFLLQKLFTKHLIYTHQGTIPAVCERTAKVIKNCELINVNERLPGN